MAFRPKQQSRTFSRSPSSFHGAPPHTRFGGRGTRPFRGGEKYAGQGRQDRFHSDKRHQTPAHAKASDRFSRRSRYLAAAREEIRESYTGKGASLIQAVRAIDDLDATRSLLFTRLDEWWKIHFPEFRLDNEETYCHIVARFGSRDEFEFTALEEIVGQDKATHLLSQAQSSYGVTLTAGEKQAIRHLAQGVLSLIECRKQLESFVETESNRVLKNLSHLLDGLVAARLLSLAGSLEKLAEMPASTLQVIGAEKALFKHLRSGTAPPKHGAIFQSSLIRGSPQDVRGKIARALSAKLAIAAKADAFTGNFIAPKLKADLEKRLKAIAKR